MEKVFETSMKNATPKTISAYNSMFKAAKNVTERSICELVLLVSS